MTPELNRTRRLVLLRHGKAEPGGREADALRPLALDGRRQSVRVGVTLTAHDLLPELVLCSSAVRARQTWELVRTGLGEVGPDVLITDAVYELGVAGVLVQVREIDERVRTVLVVGHEPTMSSITTELAGEGSDEAAAAHLRGGMSTGTFAVLELDGPWAELDRGGARLRAVVAPQD